MWIVLIRDGKGELCAKRGFQGGVLKIGRSADNDIVLPLPGASRWHGHIELRGQQLWYKDLGSANGSFTGGQRVRGPVPLTPDSPIVIAGHVLAIEPDPGRTGLPHLVVQGGEEPVTRPVGAADTFHWRTSVDQLEQQLRDLKLRGRERAEPQQ